MTSFLTYIYTNLIGGMPCISRQNENKSSSFYSIKL